LEKEGGGREGVEIWENAQYGFGDPNAFLVAFLASKKYIPGQKRSEDLHLTVNHLISPRE
jgi:hypothetical protein